MKIQEVIWHCISDHFMYGTLQTNTYIYETNPRLSFLYVPYLSYKLI
jgi:hypothetical protein